MGNNGELVAADRPSLSFPLGLALLILMLLSITAFFFCCLHWDKLRALFISSPDQEIPDAELDQKPGRPNMMEKQNESQSFSVLMPGDQVPKFIAIACPCEPPVVVEKITVIVDKPTNLCDASAVHS